MIGFHPPKQQALHDRLMHMESCPLLLVVGNAALSLGARKVGECVGCYRAVPALSLFANALWNFSTLGRITARQ